MTLRFNFHRSALVAALCGALLLAPAAFAQTAKPAVMSKMHAAIEADGNRLIEMFKDIHQNPELGFMETRTAGIVAKELRALGYEVKTGIAKTGVVGILRNGAGPTIMWRADMDANAVQEATGLPYASKVRVKRADGEEVPVAHMCGHDAHVTWMLGMAKVMAANKAEWSGTLVLVGQPAEEPVTGAKAMVADGMYTKHGVPVPDALLGVHTAPGPVGVMGSAGGVRMAGTDQIDVTFFGVGGHGSAPQTTKDPVVMAAMAVVQYQAIISRVIDPQETAVLTVGSIQAGIDNNVIPDRAEVKINLRYFNPAVREQMIAAIRNVNNGIARTYGMPEDKLPSLTMKGGSLPLVNDAELVNRINVPLKAMLGEKMVLTNLPAAVGSEDVHHLLGDHKVPMAFLLVGIVDPPVFAKAQQAGMLVPYTAHNPNYIVDPKSIPLGTKIATTMVMEMLAKK